MSDSDSDEQFESADEDFDYEDQTPHSVDKVTKHIADISLKETSKPPVEVKGEETSKPSDEKILNETSKPPVEVKGEKTSKQSNEKILNETSKPPVEVKGEETSKPSDEKILKASKPPVEVKSEDISKSSSVKVIDDSKSDVKDIGSPSQSIPVGTKQNSEEIVEESKIKISSVKKVQKTNDNIEVSRKPEEFSSLIKDQDENQLRSFHDTQEKTHQSKEVVSNETSKFPNVSGVDKNTEPSTYSNIGNATDKSTDKSSKDSKTKELSIDSNIDGWDVDIEDDINDLLPSIQGTIPPLSSTQSSKNTDLSGTSQGSSTKFSGIMAKKDEDKKKKNAQTPGVVAEMKDTDGWDVEVEDGFEIPVDLTKGSTAPASSDRFPFSLTSPLQKLTDNKEDSWGGWGAWDILSTATSGVTSLTSQVSQGFSQVLGAPDPSELAKLDKELSEQQTHSQPKVPQESQRQMPILASPDVATAPATASSGLFSFSHLTRLVETTSSAVITGGLDTLENLGKKTMEVLQDGDPGLKKKRAILFPNQDKPVLSQVLREAKGRLETQDRKQDAQEAVKSHQSPSPSSSGHSPSKNIHFETLLDDYQGLVHLEALEMLSKQCSLKLHNALMSYSAGAGEGEGEQASQRMVDFQETLQQIREMCQVDDVTNEEEDDDEEEVMGFDEKLEEVVRLYDLTSKLNCDKLIQVQKQIVLQVDRLPLESSCDVIYEQCLRSMAQFTSVSMDVFHKCASLLLLKSKHRTVDETDALTQLTHLLCARITRLSNDYSRAMMKIDPDSGLVTNVYLEAANSCSYLQDASQLLIPVLQSVAIPGAL